jgi:hypothetical protein
MLQECKKLDYSLFVEYESIQPSETQFPKKLNTQLHMIQILHSLAFIPEKQKLYFHKNLYISVHNSTIFNSPQLDRTQMSSNG